MTPFKGRARRSITGVARNRQGASGRRCKICQGFLSRYNRRETCWIHGPDPGAEPKVRPPAPGDWLEHAMYRTYHAGCRCSECQAWGETHTS